MYKWAGLLNRPEYQDLLKHENLGENICLLTVGGSHAYGLANENSDIDIRGIAVRTAEDILGMHHFDGFNQVTENTDIQIYTLDKFVNLALKGNVNVLEILFGDPSNILLCDGFGRYLLDIKEQFLSNDIYKSLRGTVRSHLNTYEKTCNEKFLRHAARLTAMSYDLFLKGEFIVEVDTMPFYKSEWQVLHSKAMQNNDVEHIMQYCDGVLEYCLEHSILEPHVDRLMAERLIIDINRKAVTRWSGYGY